MSRDQTNNQTITNLDRIWQIFGPDDLAAVCAMDEQDFPAAYGLDVTTIDSKEAWEGADWFAFKDNGSNILAVAHLDTVAYAPTRAAKFVDTEAGPVVFSRALDDRLGAYIILHMLPRLGVNVDVLLTVGEEQGCSTAQFFDTDKQYNWIIEFDRGGTDVVMYEYDDVNLRQRVRDVRAQVGMGSFSDICYLEHLGCKGLNWGVGYQDYHGPRSHAFLDDTFSMLDRFLDFHEDNADEFLPHEKQERYSKWMRAYSSVGWDTGWGREYSDLDYPSHLISSTAEAAIDDDDTAFEEDTTINESDPDWLKQYKREYTEWWQRKDVG